LFAGQVRTEPQAGTEEQAKAEPASLILDNVPFQKTFISTHPTCAAMVLDYYGVREQMKAHPAVLIGMLTNSIRRCACGREHEVWQIGQGLEKFLKDNGYQVEIREGVKASQKAEEVFTFGDYRAQIEQKRPVIVGLCKGEKAGEDLEQAIDDEGRKSLVGVGYEIEGEQEAGEGRQWLIVLDPDLKVKDGEAPEPQRILWDDPACSNMVLTFISPPVPPAAGSTAPEADPEAGR
jgi:hypothetical protein